MKSILTSIVIPTCGRPKYLPRAVESALHIFSSETEVIVVPNGNDGSWKTSLSPWLDDPRVRISPIPIDNGNAARNHGMSLARGRFIRFLDDDDYLLPGALQQLSFAIEQDADICSGNVALVSDDGRLFKTLIPPNDGDLIEGMLGPERKTGLQFHLFKTQSIAGFRFDTGISIGQDTHWMHTLCRSREWLWSKVDAQVCTWVQHDSQSQISRKLGPSDHLKLQEKMLWDTILGLQDSNRLTDARKAAAARGMWHLIHGAFFMAPGHWLPVIHKTRSRFPGTYPELALYENSIGRCIHPVLLELIMLPKRWINHGYRQVLVRLGIKSGWQFSP